MCIKTEEGIRYNVKNSRENAASFRKIINRSGFTGYPHETVMVYIGQVTDALGLDVERLSSFNISTPR